MLDTFDAQNYTDAAGNPTGGGVSGTGLTIRWQAGPLGRGADRKEPNGAFVETVLAAVKQRLEFYQTAADGKFRCPENQEAIGYLEKMLSVLNLRTVLREAREVEGTHTP